MDVMEDRTYRPWWVERKLEPWRHGRRPCPRGSSPDLVARAGLQGELLAGCKDCWSSRYWRWVCRRCGYRTRWVDGASVQDRDQAEAAYAAHRCEDR